MSDNPRQIKIEESMLNHGLGYMVRVLMPALGIEHDEEEMKDFLWDYVLKLVEESNKLNLRWSHMDIYMQVHQERGSNWDYDSSHTSNDEVNPNE